VTNAWLDEIERGIFLGETMANWKSLLNDDPTEWLLEETNPHVRYFALRWLLGKPEGNTVVAKTRQAIAESAPITKIAERQRPQGYWGSDPRPLHGTQGLLMLLLWLGAPPSDTIRRAMDYQIDGCLSENGAYGIMMKGRMMWLPCHGAEFLRMMLRYGYSGDLRSRKLLDWLVSIQQPDGVWPCVSKAKPFPCMWATADVLRAFRDIPSSWATREVIESRTRVVELFLNSNLCQYKRRKPSPEWFQFGFPLRYTSDILEVLELIAPYVSPADERIRGGLDLVLKKQNKKGQWLCEKRPRGGMWMEQYVELEKIGEPSKWVTLHAVRMLKTLYAEKK
jgi:hypothetical protein